ncbi:MAG: nuclease-related domain-containing protein [Verrucomicrobiia bacterium]
MSKEPKRSPLREKPLRQAGQSVDEQIDHLLDDKWMFYFMLASYWIVVAILAWMYRFFPQQNPLLITLIAVLVSVYATTKAVAVKRQVEQLKLGRQGERVVGQHLEELRANGYRVLHDIVADSFNIDHVLIGPAGIFSIETKTISKPSDPNAKIAYDGEMVTIAGFIPDRNPVIQAKAEADWLRKLIKKSTGRDVHVRPVVLYPGWYITPQPKGVEVWVLNLDAFPAFIYHEELTLTAEYIHLITHHLELHVRATAKM